MAFLTGLSLAQIDGSRRINLLAFPLVGLVIWNLVVYLVLLLELGALAGVHRPRAGAARQIFYEHWVSGRVESMLRQYTRFNVPLTTRAYDDSQTNGAPFPGRWCCCMHSACSTWGPLCWPSA